MCLAFWAVSCKSGDVELSLQDRIVEMEKQLEEDVTIDTALANNITSAYRKFADENPDHEKAPVYLSRSADILKELPGQGLKAVNTYNRVYELYRDHELASRSVFMIGFVFDEKYNDYERAIKSYDFFLKTYPNHPLAEDAKNLRSLLETTEGNELEKVKEWVKNSDTTSKK